MIEATKCKILFILISVCTGGAEKHVISLINQLDKKYFELHLCYLKNNTELLSQIKKDRLQGIFHGGVTKKIDFKSGLFLSSYVDEHQIDIIVSTNTYPMIYAALAKFLSKGHPLMIDVLHSTDLEKIRDKLEQWVYWPLLRVQHLLVYVSENQRTYWQQKYLLTHNDCVIHNGIDTNYFTDTYTHEEKLFVRQHYGFSQHDYLIGICAVLRPEKKHIDLLQAIKNLQMGGVTAKCLIIGDGVERNSIERQIAEFGLEKQVNITGFVQDVRRYVAACDVIAIVSHSVETFSIAALEAMSLGKPMIMSEIGGANELVKDGVNGYLFPAGNIQALETALLHLNNGNIRAVFGQSARETVEAHFTMDKMIAKFHQLFLDLQTQR